MEQIFEGINISKLQNWSFQKDPVIVKSATDNLKRWMLLVIKKLMPGLEFYLWHDAYTSFQSLLAKEMLGLAYVLLIQSLDGFLVYCQLMTAYSFYYSNLESYTF